MGQAAIYAYLLKSPNKWFFMDDIKKDLGLSQSALKKSLIKLKKNGDIEERDEYMRENNKNKLFRYFRIRS